MDATPSVVHQGHHRSTRCGPSVCPTGQLGPGRDDRWIAERDGQHLARAGEDEEGDDDGQGLEGSP